ncbi:hypothetical protein MRX96_057319 [Rhipicephalus microplus]
MMVPPRFPTDVGEEGSIRSGTTVVLTSAAGMWEEVGAGAEKREGATSFGTLVVSVVAGDDGGAVCSQEKLETDEVSVSAESARKGVP